jgi:hypothetical protein
MEIKKVTDQPLLFHNQQKSNGKVNSLDGIMPKSCATLGHIMFKSNLNLNNKNIYSIDCETEKNNFLGPLINQLTSGYGGGG